MRTLVPIIAFSLLGSALVSAPTKGPGPAPCYLTVNTFVGATLTVNGVRTEQMTAVRKFVSPALKPGETYSYTFVANYTSGGEPMVQKRQVAVQAGANITIDLVHGEAIRSTVPKTVAPVSPFDVPATPKEPKKAGGKDSAKEKKSTKPEIEVPYVPTPEPVVTAMLKAAGVKSGDTVYDLGCGDGRIVIAAVKHFKAKKGLGIDFNPERVKESETAAKAAGKVVQGKVEFRTGDVLKLTEKDFESVDVVTLYLLPSVNAKLKPVLRKGLKPGARVVSHDFDMGEDWKPEKATTVTDDEGIDHTIYLWTIPKK